MHYSKPVQEAINYINDNITSKISLETLAENVHFSPYHFHRMFLLCIGVTPMEYIIRQRLRTASQELISLECNIIEIALKYQFESQDGFSRAFKKYYGVTPGEYRNLNFHKSFHITKTIKEGKNMMLDIVIYEKLACSHSDKKEALNTLDKLLELSTKARCHGLLSLEFEIDILQPQIFKKAIQLLIDGIESVAVRVILMNYVLCGGYEGKELLIRILIIEGILAIQQGVHTVILREKLSSFFGENFINEIQTHYGLDSESQLKKIDTFIIKTQENPFLSKDTSLLEDPLNRIDQRSLQRLLREIDTITLTTAICGASGKTQGRVLKNLSKKLAVMLIDQVDAIGTPIISEITTSQKQILETLNMLRNQGEIIS